MRNRRGSKQPTNTAPLYAFRVVYQCIRLTLVSECMEMCSNGNCRPLFAVYSTTIQSEWTTQRSRMANELEWDEWPEQSVKQRTWRPSYSGTHTLTALAETGKVVNDKYKYLSKRAQVASCFCPENASINQWKFTQRTAINN